MIGEGALCCGSDHLFTMESLAAAYDYRCGALDEEDNEVVDVYRNMLCVSRTSCILTPILIFGRVTAVTP